ncbi:MAG TPA: hypothetical protein VK958_06395 [Methylophilus sp.]|uniref:hypothetical protein n=1 Tax=Methylophilus sp. TaxID=29541 RepID=UPI002B8DF8EF|nr:hypothetical protein [Methylophilus sp.]HSH86864.1 hypothetical protein [Methylophilus sp.]
MKFRHFICEDIRQELNGKVTLTGVYPDDCLLMPEILNQDENAKEITAIERLMLLVNISELDKDTEVFAEILKPDGTIHGVTQPLGTTKAVKNRSFNVIMNLSGFPVPIAGIYTIKLRIDENQYEVPINIQLENPQIL